MTVALGTSLTLALSAGALLAVRAAAGRARARAGGTTTDAPPLPRALDVAALVAAGLAAASAGILVMALCFDVLPALLGRARADAPVTPRAPAGGAEPGAGTILGYGITLALLLVLVRGVVAAIAPLVQWATHRPIERLSLPVLARTALVEVAGLVALTVPLFWLVVSAGGTWAAGIAIYLAVAMYPLFDAVVVPWLLLARAGRAAARDAREPALSRQVNALAAAAGVRGRLRTVVLPGTVRNAYAVGVGRTRWVVVGAGLLDAMAPDEVRAILAHEVAHIARSDVPRLLAVALAATMIFVAARQWVAAALGPTGVLGTAVTGGLLGGLVLVALPGLVSRRLEFGADRLAARLLPDPEALCSALLRLAALHRQPPEAASMTHPSPARRVAAIRAGTSRPSADANRAEHGGGRPPAGERLPTSESVHATAR